MTDIMYDLPSREDVREIVITKEAITEGTSPADRDRARARQAGGVRRAVRRAR